MRCELYGLAGAWCLDVERETCLVRAPPPVYVKYVVGLSYRDVSDLRSAVSFVF